LQSKLLDGESRFLHFGIVRFMLPASKRPVTDIWLIAAWLLFGFWGTHNVVLAHQWDMASSPRRDFVQIFAGARCFIHHRDPYNTALLEQQYISAGGLQQNLPPWKWELPLYPPTALLFGVPFAGLSFNVAAEIWFWIGALAFVASLAAVPFLVPPRRRAWAVLLASMSAALPSTVLVMGMGQPAALALAALLVAVVLMLRNAPRAFIITALAVALLLKPQLAMGFVIYFLISARYRRTALCTLGVYSVLLAASVIWLQSAPSSAQSSAQWHTTLHQNLVSTLSTGGSDSPDPDNVTINTFANLQAITILFFSSPRAWLIAILRHPWSPIRDWLALAAAACLALLPAYGLYYNFSVLALTIPAVIWLIFHKPAWGAAAFVTLLPTAFWNIQLHVQHAVSNRPLLVLKGRVGTILMYRQYPLSLTIAAAVLTIAVWRYSPRTTRAPS
jgi:hypothetical protein